MAGFVSVVPDIFRERKVAAQAVESSQAADLNTLDFPAFCACTVRDRYRTVSRLVTACILRLPQVSTRRVTPPVC